jgi:hypothetical protein
MMIVAFALAAGTIVEAAKINARQVRFMKTSSLWTGLPRTPAARRSFTPKCPG